MTRVSETCYENRQPLINRTGIAFLFKDAHHAPFHIMSMSRPVLSTSLLLLLLLFSGVIGLPVKSLLLQEQSQSQQNTQEAEASLSQAPAARASQSQGFDFDKARQFFEDLRTQLPQSIDKERLHELAEQAAGLMSGSRLGLQTINLESIPSPIAFFDAYWDTLDEFAPEIFGENKLAALFVRMMKFARKRVQDNPNKLISKT